MSAQHTPGPWAVEEPMDHELWIVEDGKEAYEWRVIAGCPWPDEPRDIPRKQVEANARLIAAAPDLLAALEKAAPFIGWASTRGQILAGVDADELCDVIDAAIAKATGEA